MVKNLSIYADNSLTLTIHACITSWQNHSPWYTRHKAFSTWKLQLIQGDVFYTIFRRRYYHQQPLVLSISSFFIPHTPYQFLKSISDFSFSFLFLTSDCSVRWVQTMWWKKTLQISRKQDRGWQLLFCSQWNCLRYDKHIWSETGVIYPLKESPPSAPSINCTSWAFSL